MKFEEAFYLTQGINLPLYDISDIYIQNLKVFENKYRNFLYCPECHQAKLSYNNASTPYLSSYPQAQHDTDCSLAQDVATATDVKRILKEYDKNNEIRHDVERQIDSTMRLLLAEDKAIPIRVNAVQEERNNINHIHQQRNVQQAIRPRIPRKRIDLVLQDNDYNVDKIFYGNVILRWKEEEKTEKQQHYRKILLYTLKNHKFKCAIKITDSVYAHLPQDYKTINDTQCKIVFIAQLDKGNKQIRSENCGFATLYNSQLIKIST